MLSRARAWIESHKDYPHDWCLIWPFAREGRVGRGIMGRNRGKSAWVRRKIEMVAVFAPLTIYGIVLLMTLLK